MHLLKLIGTRFPVATATANVSRAAHPQAFRRFAHRLMNCFTILVLMGTLAACSETSNSANGFGGHPRQGASLIRKFGCGTCHTIPGIADANGEVGPPLTAIARRVYIAGMLRNSPGNLIRWLKDPQAVVPGNAMPKMGISDDEARDIAAYLYTLD
jgi:cytochrome c2